MLSVLTVLSIIAQSFAFGKSFARKFL